MGAAREKFFLPSLSPVAFLNPNANPKGFNFYSPQSSSVIKSKMAVTALRHKQTTYYARIAGHRLKT